MTFSEIASMATQSDILDLCNRRWAGRIPASFDSAAGICRLTSQSPDLLEIYEWLTEKMEYTFATLIVEDSSRQELSLTYVFYGEAASPWVYVELQVDSRILSAPSLVGLSQGPAVDWHEREAAELFGMKFEGHPRLGEFVLHEDWPAGVAPMRKSYDARRTQARRREPSPSWQAPTILRAQGSFAMPVGPVFSDFAEAAHFLLETVGEDVIHTIPRFFYKYRGVEKIAEGQRADNVLLLAERFSGVAALAHGLGFCRAVEAICGIEATPRAQALRTILAELERLRHHAATITGVCHSTALAVATSQAALIEEDLLRLTCEISRHRYFFGMLELGGLAFDVSDESCRRLSAAVGDIDKRLGELHRMLRYSSSFLDRLEEVGVLSGEAAVSYGLVGPIARASGIARDMRKLRPYASYKAADFTVPSEQEGDGYARLRVFFREAEQSVSIIRQLVPSLPKGEIHARRVDWRAGAALAAVEAPSGAAFQWVRLGEDGTVARYRVMPPAFTNWHGFHLAAENFAFRDFPIILASFGLSNAECDR